MQTIKLTAADDFHCHLRDQPYLKTTVGDTAAQFRRAIIMPNLVPPISTIAEAQAYYQRIMQALADTQHQFTPLMTLYMTESMSTDTITAAKQSDFIHAIKLYPAGATTHSSSGVINMTNIFPLLEAMQECDLPLLIHGEVVDDDIDIFDREAVFIDRHLEPIIRQFPKLRIVLEHISTSYAVDYIKAQHANVAATITPHHLILNRNDLLVGGIRPHYYCLPIVKKHRDQEALISAATSGNGKFFSGTDSAPHTRHSKESACGCAGIYNSPVALAIYATVFEQQNALNKLEAFTSQHGAHFYQLPPNNNQITLIKQPWVVPDSINYGPDTLIPLMAGQTLDWQLQSKRGL